MYDPFHIPNFYWSNDSPDPANRHLSVLLVEDDVQAQIYMDRLLKSVDGDLSVDRVATAEEAKDLLDHSETDHYDLVIADQFLKGTDTGLDLWNYCRKRHPFVQFMLTSGTEVDKYLSMHGARADIPEFMKKNLSFEATKRRLKSLITATRRHAPIREALTVHEAPVVHPILNTNEAVSESLRNQRIWGAVLFAYTSSLLVYSLVIMSAHELSFKNIMNRKIEPEIMQPASPELNPWFEELNIPQTPNDWKKLRDFKMLYPEVANK